MLVQCRPTSLVPNQVGWKFSFPFLWLGWVFCRALTHRYLEKSFWAEKKILSWTRDKFCVYDTGLKKKQMSVRVDIVAQMQHSWMLTSILHLFFLVWVSGRFFGLLRRPLRLAHLRHFFHVRRKRRLSQETVAKLKTKLLGSHCCGRYLFVTFNNFFKISSVWRP